MNTIEAFNLLNDGKKVKKTCWSNRYIYAGISNLVRWDNGHLYTEPIDLNATWEEVIVVPKDVAFITNLIKDMKGDFECVGFKCSNCDLYVEKKDCALSILNKTIQKLRRE